VLVVGSVRSGKTHTLHVAAAALTQQGNVVRLIEGKEFAQKSAELMGCAVTPDSTLIIDDVEQIFAGVSAQELGKFVSVVEHWRAGGGKIICSTSQRDISQVVPEQLPADVRAHVVTRLREGVLFVLQEPDDSHFADVVEAMLLQRSIKLPRKSILFLVKRLPRSIPAVEEYISSLDYLSSVLGEDITLRIVGDAVGSVKPRS
jgi:chromosomal replication initiation ATPase DnaA